MKNISVISIGDELLFDKLNTNLIDICKVLPVKNAFTIRDIKSEIKKILSLAMTDSEIIIVTGGLGQTVDDLTEETVFEIIKEAKIIDLPNEMGTALGKFIEHKNKIVVLLPRPPHEMKNMLIKEVLPRLNFNYSVSYQIYFKTFEIGEMEIQKRIFEFAETYPEKINFKLSLLPDFYIVTVKLELETENLDFKAGILALFEDKLLTLENISLEESFVRTLSAKGLTLSTAESCTGGLVAKMITDVSGSSQCFLGGYVAYSNELKISMLGVLPEILEKYGAVSEEVVCEMAEGALKVTSSDFAIATTGFAEPVGLVYVAIAGKDRATEVFTVNSRKDRDTVRKRAAVFALGKLFQKIS